MGSPNGAPLRRVVRIVNPLGLHHRVADRFARTAGGFDARITVRNGDLSADGKSLWDLMMLLAFEGTDVVLELDGPEAAAALEPLAAILAARGGEDYAI
jgi:phosphocarrier protein HPr